MGRIKYLNPAGALIGSDKVGVDRTSPDESMWGDLDAVKTFVNDNAWELIETLTPSGVSSVEVSLAANTFYKLIYVLSTTTGAIKVQLGTASAWATTGYSEVGSYDDGVDGTRVSDFNTSTTEMSLVSYGFDGKRCESIYYYDGTTATLVTSYGNFDSPNSYNGKNTNALATSDLTRLKFYLTSGTLSGTIKVLKMK